MRLNEVDAGMVSYRKLGTTLTDAAVKAALDAEAVIRGLRAKNQVKGSRDKVQGTA